jgi:cytochrome c553
MKMRAVLGVVGLSLCACVAHAAGDPVAGQKKAETCMGCHGVPGYRNASPAYHVPKLGNQHPEYIVAALKAYKSGERNHPTMRAQAAALSETDMADLAAYFATFKAN